MQDVPKEFCFLFTREESMLLLETWNLMIGVGICKFVIFLWRGM